MKKRVLSVLLAALLLLACLPILASASGSDLTVTTTPIGGEYPAKRGNGDSIFIPYTDAENQSCVCGNTFYMQFMLMPNGNNDQYYNIEICDKNDNFIDGVYDKLITGTEAQVVTLTWPTGSNPAGEYHIYSAVSDTSGNFISESVFKTNVYLVKNAIPLKSVTVKDTDTDQVVSGWRQMQLTDDSLWLYLEYNPYNATGNREKKIQVSQNDVVMVEEWGGFIVVTPIGYGKATVTITVDGISAYFGIEIVDPGDPNDPCYGYTDISRSQWYHSAADFVISRGIMGSTQTSKLTFEPNTACTRSMIVSILYRLQGSPAVSYEARFPDVPEGQWYTSAVIWTAQNGIVSGYDNGKFGPNDKITREQMAVILKGYSDLKGIDTNKIADLSDFPDCGKVTWSKPAMRWAVAEGLISGKASGGQTLLDPQGNASRAEVASILMRYIQNILK